MASEYLISSSNHNSRKNSDSLEEKMANDKRSHDKIKNLVAAIRKEFPRQYDTDTELARALGINSQSLGSVLKKGMLSDTLENKYFPLLIGWLERKHGIEAILDEHTLIFRLSQKLEPDNKQLGHVFGPLDFSSFIQKVLEGPGEQDIIIIGTWPPSIVGRTKRGASAEIRAMIKHSKSVKMLMPKPDGHFFSERLYQLYYDDEGEFEHRKSDLVKSLQILNSLKIECGNPDKFDFRLYDYCPGTRLFADNNQIHLSIILSDIETIDTFSTTYPNDKSLAATQLNQHFKHIWDNAQFYHKSSKYNLLPLDNGIPGVYKVYTYGHTQGETPSTIIGTLKIEANGELIQHTYRSENKYDINLGRVRKVGNNLFMEVRNTREPKFTALSIIRMASSFKAEPGQYLFGTLIVPKQVSSKPVALRVILERKADNIRFEDIQCLKIPIMEDVSHAVIPKNVRKMLSGVFRNMLRFQDDDLFNEISIENEFKKTKVKLGRVLYAYAKLLKSEHGSEESIVSAVRWALTHGFTGWEAIEAEFGELVSLHEPTQQLLERIKRDNP